jgi:hypothetical protein
MIQSLLDREICIIAQLISGFLDLRKRERACGDVCLFRYGQLALTTDKLHFLLGMESAAPFLTDRRFLKL